MILRGDAGLNKYVGRPMVDARLWNKILMNSGDGRREGLIVMGSRIELEKVKCVDVYITYTETKVKTEYKKKKTLHIRIQAHRTDT